MTDPCDRNVDPAGFAVSFLAKDLAGRDPRSSAEGRGASLAYRRWIPSDDDQVLAANRAFYAAFEARDMDAMSDLWEHSDRTSCVHPGWNRLNGWGAISASWFALFQNGQDLQFIITNERVDLAGDVAWVSCDENLLSDQQVGGTVAALNVFVREGSGWRLIVHHGSPVVDRE